MKNYILRAPDGEPFPVPDWLAQRLLQQMVELEQLGAMLGELRPEHPLDTLPESDPLAKLFWNPRKIAQSYDAKRHQVREVLVWQDRAYFCQGNVIRQEWSRDELEAKLAEEKRPESRELLEKILDAMRS